MEVPEALVSQALSVQPEHLHVGAPQLHEGVDALVTEIVHLVDVELFKAVTDLTDEMRKLYFTNIVQSECDIT